MMTASPTSDRKSLPSRVRSHAHAQWQTIVLARINGGAFKPNSHDTLTVAAGEQAWMQASGGDFHRFDVADQSVPVPKLLANWSADVGWHRSLRELSLEMSAETHFTKAAFFADDRRFASVQLPFGSTGAGQRLQIRADSATPSPELQPRPSEATRIAVAANAIANGTRTGTLNDRILADRLAEAAHDIRCPISVARQIINAFTFQARGANKFSSGELDLLDIANLRLLQASQWAEGILISRNLEYGQTINIRHRFYPDQWRATVEPMLMSVAARRRVNLSWVGWDRSLPRLYLDENQLSRAVLNLVTNAVQACPIGGEVSIRVGVQSDGSQRLVLAIQDNGRGMDAELRSEVNSPDALLTSDVPSGRVTETFNHSPGIGLRTAKKLIMGIGGRLLATSYDTGGTLMRITLPTDNPRSLLRSWLMGLALKQPVSDQQSRFILRAYAIRLQDVDPRFADSHLQQSVGAEDFVYRLSKDRWLAFSLTAENAERKESTIEAAVRQLREMTASPTSQSKCHSQVVYSLRAIQLGNLQGKSDSPTQLMRIVSLLSDRMQTFAGRNVPPLDDLTAEVSSIVFRPVGGGRSRRIRQDLPQVGLRSKLATRNRSRAASASASPVAPHSRVPTGPGQPNLAPPHIVSAKPTGKTVMPIESNTVPDMAGTATATVARQRSTPVVGAKPMNIEQPTRLPPAHSSTHNDGHVALKNQAAMLNEVSKLWRADQTALRSKLS